MRKESETEEAEIDEEMILDTPWHKIYQENRKEAAKNHQKFDFLQLELTENGMANNTKLPHYNGVMDSPYLKEVMISIQKFRPKLLAFMSHQKKLAYKRDAVLSKKYDSDIKIFNDKMTKWENSPKKRLRDQRNREQAEKVFPDLKRQREAKDRLSRTANRDTARSEADIGMIVEFFKLNMIRLNVSSK